MNYMNKWMCDIRVGGGAVRGHWPAQRGLGTSVNKFNLPQPGGTMTVASVFNIHTSDCWLHQYRLGVTALVNLEKTWNAEIKAV